MAYQLFSSLKTTELRIRRHGLLQSYYELTDEKSTFGKLKFGGLFLRQASVETAQGTWIFKRKSFFSKIITITDNKGLPVAQLAKKWFSKSVLLTMADGTRNLFSHPSFWKRKYTFTNDRGKVMEFQSRFADRNPVKIILPKNFQPNNQTLLMAFTGAYLLLVMRREKAAAAAH
ncbi:hypothetical protein [Mucilaginibacter arboris]|uniref:Uncharacterized protein n=1 Tax=Mucilaginibacter arboris TaxID=2682090 RepID=A0A7K1SZ53_9SPHI|nr:hypothetical protein [Mucilaginibacter arboris]MVN22537.1 hypothetical protein [Mucilaginibacter arboris]